MFPNIKRANEWYITGLDGLVHLGSALHSPQTHLVSDATYAQIFGMTSAEWNHFLGERKEEHELFASLALLASCEGAIRRDLALRVASQGPYHGNFKKYSAGGHVSITVIISRWLAVLGRVSFARKHLVKLLSLYRARNELAHGRANIGQFSFPLLREDLYTIQRKWRQAVPDFHGF